ncbi:oligosaccharide flippase family protein [Olivibacter sp. SA151]|uniref:lipopolysaccharide biosynthesis protein n=1 Tax=Olivibacter jilunii TaxID=985016 RepID=UPI003F18C630
MKLYRWILAKLNTDFNRNFAVLLSGTLVSQVIPLIASIFLARIYSPKDFGVLAIFNALYSTITPIICLRYEFAITLPKKDKDAINIALLSFILALLISLVLVIVIFLFKHKILSLVGGEYLGDNIYFVPIMTLLGGIYSILNYFSVRYKRFRVIASSNIIRSLSQSFIQLLLGIFRVGKLGLILGVVLSNLSGNAKMFKHFLSFSHLFGTITKRRIFLNAVRYKKFPIVSSWGVILNSISLNINNFFISNLYGVNTLGFYSYGYRYLNLPLSLVSNNVSQVFYQVCSECQKNSSNAKSEYISTLKKIIVISAPFFLVLFFIVEDLFAFCFGETWRQAGLYAKILLPLFFVRSIFSPLSLITIAFERQFLMLVMQILIFTFNLGAFLGARIFHLDIRSFLSFYSYSSSALYLVLTYLLYLVSIRKL